MLMTEEFLLDRPLAADDGEIGWVRDALFDDESWTIRYLVVDVGGFLDRKLVLVSPRHIVGSGMGALRVTLKRQQVAESPDIDVDAPVSRIAEQRYHDYYSLEYYWRGPYLWGGSPYPGMVNPPYPSAPPYGTTQTPANSSDAERLRHEAAHPDSSTHIRSMKEVIGYGVRSRDASFGSIDHAIVEDDSWAIRYFVIDTKRFWPSKTVLLPTDFILDVSWTHEEVSFDLSEDDIKSMDSFDSLDGFTRDDEERIFRHFGRAGYWEKGMAFHHGRRSVDPSQFRDRERRGEGHT